MVGQRFTLIFLLISVLCTINCSKDETPAVDSNSKEEPKPEEPNESESEVYFTYKSPFYSTSENWVIIHDENGRLMDYKLLDKEGKTYEFSISKDEASDEFSVTTMINDPHSNDPTKFNHWLATYTNVKKGVIWDRSAQQPSSLQPEKIGSFEIAVTDIPRGPYVIYISTTSGRVFELTSKPSQENGTTTMSFSNVAIYKDETYFIHLLDANNFYRYIPLGHPDNNANLQLSHGDFLPYDSYSEITLPPYESISYTSIGYTQNGLLDYHPSRGTFFTHTFGVKDVSNVPLGYLDGFEKYSTTFSIQMEEYGYGITQFGERIMEISILPKPSFSLIDSTIYDFECSTDMDFVRKQVGWNTGNFDSLSSNTQWVVYSLGTTSHAVGILPNEITSKYPTLNLDKMKLTSVNLFARSLPHSKISGTGKSLLEFSEDYVSERVLFNDF